MHLITSHSGFKNSAWLSIASDVQITQQPNDLDKITHGDTLWLLVPQPNWLDLIKHSVSNGAKVVAMYSIPNKDEMEKALMHGAYAYCPVTADESTLTAVKQAGLSESLWIPSAYIRLIASGLNGLTKKQSEVKRKIHNLNISPKEQGVVELILEGKTNAEIASELFISERTVKEHLTKVFKKLKVKDRLQLALLILGSE